MRGASGRPGIGVSGIGDTFVTSVSFPAHSQIWKQRRWSQPDSVECAVPERLRLAMLGGRLIVLMTLRAMPVVSLDRRFIVP
jgi:hypothetical protein